MSDDLDIVGLRMELTRAMVRVESLSADVLRLTKERDAAVKRAEAAEEEIETLRFDLRKERGRD